MVINALVLPVHVANLRRPDSLPHGRVVGVRANVLGQLRHVGLAEALDLGVRLGIRVEICASKGSTNRLENQGVAEGGVECSGLHL